MKIRIHRVVNRTYRETLREAASLFLTELIPDNLQRKLTVDIVINPYLRAIWGSCRANKTHRKFEIELHPHKWNEHRMIKTLGHECIHIKQYATGEMKELNDEITVWKSKKFIADDIPYHMQPWEIEAAGDEELYWMIWKDYKRDKLLKNKG